MPSISCPGCDSRFQIDGSLYVKKTRCTRCRMVFEVDPPAPGRENPEHSAAARRIVANPQKRSRPREGKRGLLVGGTAAALVLILLAGVVWVSFPREKGNRAQRSGGTATAPEIDPAESGSRGHSGSRTGRKHALLVGVRDYEHPKLSKLRFTENDVEGLAEALRVPGVAFDSVRLLTTSRGARDGRDLPTADNIRVELDGLLDAAQGGDTILIALSGHGVQLSVADPDGRGRDRSFPYFCPSDCDFRNIAYSSGRAKRLIQLETLFADLGKCRAREKLVLIDACRNAVDADSSTRNADTQHVKIPRGVGVMFSCKAEERAWETAKLGKGHGVFFHFVLEGLRGKARNEDGDITWDDLSRYVKRQVIRRVPEIIGEGARQTPHGLNNIEGETVLARLAGKPRPEGGQARDDEKRKESPGGEDPPEVKDPPKKDGQSPEVKDPPKKDGESPGAKDRPKKDERTQVKGKGKFRGKVNYDRKSGEATFTYDFTSKEQLDDFEAEGQGGSPDVTRGVLQLPPRINLRHKAKFINRLTITTRCVRRVGENHAVIAVAPQGYAFWISANNKMCLHYPPNDVIENRIAPGDTWDVELIITEKNLRVKIGNILFGKTMKTNFAGQALLRGAEKGNEYYKLTLKGRIDPAWAGNMSQD